MQEEIALYFNSGDVPWAEIRWAFMSSGCRSALAKGPSSIGFYVVKLPSEAPRLV